MRIASFELVDVGPLKRISVHDMADIVVFAGPNGVGKTHISSALIRFAQNPGASPNVHMTIEARSGMIPKNLFVIALLKWSRPSRKAACRFGLLASTQTLAAGIQRRKVRYRNTPFSG